MMRRRSVAIALALTGLMLAGAGLAGCTWFQPKMQSVPDLSGSFHFYIPETWRQNQTPGLVAVYASDKLPSDPTAAQSSVQSAPSLLVLTSSVPSTTPVAAELTHLVQLRASGRSWKQKVLAAPESVQIGGRRASRVAVTGIDSTGVNFKAAYYLIRTAGHEYFLAATASPDKWDAFAKQVDTVLKDWFWQLPADQSTPVAPAPAPKAKKK